MSNVVADLLACGEGRAPVLLGPGAGEQITWSDLRRAVAAAIATVIARTATGDRVGILAANGPEFVASYLGILGAGRVAVPLPTTAGADVLGPIARRAGMRGLFTDARHAELAPEIGVVRLELGDHGPTEVVSVPDDALAALMFTSGSTGEPKGVMITHGNIAANTDDIVSYLGLRSDDRIMVVLPFHYCYGLSLLHTHLRVGASLVLNNAFLFAERVLDELERHGCTGFAGVPATYQMLLRKTTFARRSFPRLRALQQAGGRLPEAQLLELRAAVPNARLFVMYGQTEATARLSYLPPERLDDKLGSIGRGLASTRLRVVRPDGSDLAPGSDEIGEIVAAGPAIASGYWDDEDETRRFFRTGELWTGDMARIDSDGFVYVVDRAREFVKVMGVRISPQEVESVIAELPEVVEVAVVGVSDPLTGEALVALVVADASATPDAVRRHCMARLPNTKVPSRVILLDQLPKTAAGKVARQKLRELVV